MAFRTRTFHRIHRTLWVQEALEYRQFTQVIEILRGRFKSFAANDQAFGDLVDALVKENTAPKLVAIILKPYQPTILHALWNSHWATKYKIDMTDPIQRMTLEQVAEVLLGFFVVNTRSIRRFLNSPQALALKKELMPMLQSLTPVTPPSSQPPTVN